MKVSIWVCLHPSSINVVKVIIWVCLHLSATDVVKHVCLKAFHSGLKGLDVVVLDSFLMRQTVYCALKLCDALLRVVDLKKCYLLGDRSLKRVVEVPRSR
jgi:hypothetical protein